MSVELTRTDDVATITISNPDRKNAISVAASEDMAEYVHEVAHDDGVRCVVVQGEGDAFCSGIDLAEGMGGGSPTQELERGLNAIVAGLVRMRKPTVAKVRGPAVGAGASLATACDFVYAEQSATFGWGFTDIGLAPDTGATWVLPRLVGVRRALELLATGEQISAEEAVALDIANDAVPDADLDGFVDQRVEMLASRPTEAVAAAKRLVYRSGHRSFEEALRAEAREQERMVETEDFAEGVAAFAENREPEFQGR
ncbi:enoyl-CoA hydratase/isomerase family protein [Halorarius halobius]|uniref:enoyl-CoA hydratase/isomerase family protein n=1 Tax=Halorarius halobius TaxID=2962671 RepID=UPI0020CD1D23|nr:enoyl-CoA hydratase-related protein [Halorarius halobius]